MDKSKATPLHNACGQGNISMVKLLMAAGANMLAYDDDLMTPFHYAILSGHLKVGTLLQNINPFLMSSCIATR